MGAITLPYTMITVFNSEILANSFKQNRYQICHMGNMVSVGLDWNLNLMVLVLDIGWTNYIVGFCQMAANAEFFRAGLCLKFSIYFKTIAACPLVPDCDWQNLWWYHGLPVLDIVGVCLNFEKLKHMLSYPGFEVSIEGTHSRTAGHFYCPLFLSFTHTHTQTQTHSLSMQWMT